MRKLLIGLGVAVVVVAAAGYAGTEWLRYRFEREVEAAFASFSATAGPASHGPTRFNPFTRTIKISDVALQAKPRVMGPTRVGELVFAGVPLMPGDRITARRVELTGIELAADTAATKTMRVEAITIDDPDVSRQVDWQRLRAVVEGGPPPPGTPPKAALSPLAEALEGLRFTGLEMRGLSFREGAKGIDVASVRLAGVADGRFAELTVRGVSSVALPDKVTVGRVTLRKLDLAGLLRKSAQLAPDRPPTPEELAVFAAMLEGIEAEEMIVPDERPGHPPGATMHVLSAQFSWGRFVGLLPTTARYAARVEMPLADAAEPFQVLRDSGRKTVTIAMELGTTWTEQTRALVVSPATVELEDLFSTSLTLSIGNFSPNLLVMDQAKILAAAAALEVGPLEVTFHDSGGLDFMVAEAARKQGVGRDEARKRLADEFARNAGTTPGQSPELRRIVDALGRFLGGSGGTLKISLTPRGHVSVLQTVELIKIDPIAALSQFSVEAVVVGR